MNRRARIKAPSKNAKITDLKLKKYIHNKKKKRPKKGK